MHGVRLDLSNGPVVRFDFMTRRSRCVDIAEEPTAKRQRDGAWTRPSIAHRFAHAQLVVSIHICCLQLGYAVLRSEGCFSTITFV